MKKDTRKLEKHLEKYPTDANSVISLLKARSHNFEYEFNLKSKKKKERLAGIRRKKRKEEAKNE